MKMLARLLASLFVAAALAPGARVDARPSAGRGTQVVCNGVACGGNGGSLGCDFVYRIQTGGGSISSLDVAVEDGDVAHYTFFGPPGWGLSIVSLPWPHDVSPSDHGAASGSTGECAHVLRFAGPAMTKDFEVGFDYVQSHPRFHDVQWKASDGRHADWGAALGTSSGPVHSPLRLNVLLIVLDDVGTDRLELFDTPHAPEHAFARAPTLEALADQGVRFTNFYVNPLCGTTRACLQTGRYALRHGIGMLASDFALQSCELTLAELLKLGFASPGAAYRSGAFGKWHLAPGIEVLQFVSHPVRSGYERFYGFLANGADHFDWFKIEHDLGALDPVGIEVDDHWSADVAREDAANWIATTAEPFLAYVAFNPPHSPFTPPPFETRDGRSLLSQETRDALLSASPDDHELFYLAMLEAVDAEIGHLLDDIGPDKLARTMVLVVSDNGTPGEMVRSPHPTKPNHAKNSIYQLGVRVPLIVAGPLAASGVCEAAVGAVDVWHTIAEITGADADVFAPVPCPDSTRDGVSFLPLIQDPSGVATRPAFAQIFAPNGIVDGGTIACLERHERAVTDGAFKYVRKLLQDDGSLSCQPCSAPCGYEHEFYDLIADPDESINLYPPPEELQAIYDSLSSYMDAVSEF